ncbi:MAG: hypothetical protein ACLVBP_02570 [Ruminococcus sp.]
MKGLKYTDIDKKENVIHVQRTLKYIEGRGYLEDTPENENIYKGYSINRGYIGTSGETRKGIGALRWNVWTDIYSAMKRESHWSRERVQAEIDRTIKRIRAAGHDFPRIILHMVEL